MLIFISSCSSSIRTFATALSGGKTADGTARSAGAKKTGDIDVITVDDVRAGISRICHKPAGRRAMGFLAGDQMTEAAVM